MLVASRHVLSTLKKRGFVDHIWVLGEKGRFMAQGTPYGKQRRDKEWPESLRPIARSCRVLTCRKPLFQEVCPAL